MSSACWWLGGGGASGEVDGAHGPGALEVEEVGGEGLAAEIVNEGERGLPWATLDRTSDKRMRKPLYSTCTHVPANKTAIHCLQSAVLEAVVHPRAVHAVIRLLEVEEGDAPPATVTGSHLLEPVNLLELEQHVVCDVTAGDEGRLGDGQDVIGRTAHARGEDAGYELVVAVEEGDGAVALATVARLAAALVKADNKAEAL